MSNPSFELEYFEIAEATALTAHSERKKNKKYRAFIAAKIDGVRLIDNLAMN
jgi:pantoate--beta-alanine ligase